MRSKSGLMFVAKRPRRAAALGAAAMFIATLATGCSFEASVRYSPGDPPVDLPTASVALKTVNRRPPAHGGQTKCIERVRGGYGNPFPIYEKDAANVEIAVRDATADALLRAGISTADGGGPVLVTSVDEYWLDGFGSFNATVTVDLVLQDAQGAPLWHRSVTSTGGDTMSWSVFEADRIAPTAFGYALRGVAAQLVTEFQGDEFQRLVRPAPTVATR